MTWQDELRRLDAELAGGQLSHDRHRKLRDELLAGASGGAAPSPVASPLRRPKVPPWPRTNAGSPVTQPMTQPVTQPVTSVTQPVAMPAPPTPTPTPPPPPSPMPMPTPMPTPSSLASLLANGAPQTAPSPADQRRTDSMPYPNPNDQPTVVRPAVLPPAPPLMPPANVGQYPVDNPFAEPPNSRRKPVLAFITLGVVLVLALILGGFWWLKTNQTDTAQPPPSAAIVAPPNSAAAPPPSSPTGPPALEDSLPKLPGTPDKNSGTMSISRGTELSLYSKEAQAFFTTKGVDQVVFHGSNDGSNGYLLLVVPAKNPGDAGDIVKYLHDNSVGSGLKEQKLGSLVALTGKNQNGQLSGTGYVSGSLAVTAWVSQGLGGDPAALNQRLTETVTELKKTLPAN